MIRAPQLLVDENIGRPITRSLAQLLAWHESKPEIHHILDFENEGTTDDLWLHRMKQEGWVVLSADRVRRYGGAKLPRICRELGVSHVLLGAALAGARQFEKARAVVALWPELVKVRGEPPGTGYTLRNNPHHQPMLVKRA